MIGSTDIEDMFLGWDEPEAMYANGAHHKQTCRELGLPEPKDVDGLPLVDGEVYVLTKNGYTLVLP